MHACTKETVDERDGVDHWYSVSYDYRMCSLTSEWLLVLVSNDCMNARMRASTRVSELACACAGETIPNADVATAQKMLIGIVRLRPR